MNARLCISLVRSTRGQAVVASYVILGAVMFGTIGCTPNPQDFVATNENPPSTSGAAPTAPGAQTPPSSPAQGMPAAPGMAPIAPATSPPATSPPPENLVRAQAGVGAKGRSLDQHEGVIVTPAKSLFAVKERAVFDILIPQAMQLFKATNGQGPASHEEFMQKIVTENNIQLPQLPPGHEYMYDPQTELLMVRK